MRPHENKLLVLLPVSDNACRTKVKFSEFGCNTCHRSSFVFIFTKIDFNLLLNRISRFGSQTILISVYSRNYSIWIWQLIKLTDLCVTHKCNWIYTNSLCMTDCTSAIGIHRIPHIDNTTTISTDANHIFNASLPIRLHICV